MRCFLRPGTGVPELCVFVSVWMLQELEPPASARTQKQLVDYNWWYSFDLACQPWFLGTSVVLIRTVAWWVKMSPIQTKSSGMPG